MQRFLITGGAGFIGSALCERLILDGSEVVVLDNFSSGKMANLSCSQKMGDPGQLTVIDGDIRGSTSLLSDYGEFDAIVHLAALISGYDSLHAPNDYVDVNVSGLLRVIEFCAKKRIPRIIFASSSTVYGNNPSLPLGETAVPSPLTVYAVTKLTGEHLLSLYSRIYGFSYCCLRLFNVYGPRQAVDHPYANVTCKFAYAASRQLPVTRFGDGEQSRDFVFIDDVVTAFLLVLEQAQHTVYNVGTGESQSVNNLLAALEKITGRPLEIRQSDSWPNDIRSIRADITRLAEEFHFTPANDLTIGLRRTLKSFEGRDG